MWASTILFEKMAETLLLAIGHFLICLVGKEEAGERSCQFAFSFTMKIIAVQLAQTVKLGLLPENSQWVKKENCNRKKNGVWFQKKFEYFTVCFTLNPG